MSVFEQASTEGRLRAMGRPSLPTPESVIRGYFRAKDENRPHLLDGVFASNAQVVIRNQSENIAFPAVTQGRSAIAEVLVRSFTLSYENIYSFYLGRPKALAHEFTCAWLVGMSERSSGDVRVGCGTYDWVFEREAPALASRLTITIEAMQILPVSEFETVFAWLGSLSYPWSSAASALRVIPRTEQLLPVAAFLARNVAVA